MTRLKQDLASPVQNVPQQGVTPSPPSSDANPGYHLRPLTDTNTPLSSTHGQRVGQGGISSHGHAPVLGCMDPHLIHIPVTKRYFEVCVNIGNYAIDHHETDISDVENDSELFKRIWQKYCNSRGGRIRRLFLQPRNIHFVMVSY